MLQAVFLPLVLLATKYALTKIYVKRPMLKYGNIKKIFALLKWCLLVLVAGGVHSQLNVEQ